MNPYNISQSSSAKKPDFFEYWESLGFFENIHPILPEKFYLLFEIARTIFTLENESEALSAIKSIAGDFTITLPDRDKSILINRAERTAPIGNSADIGKFRTIYDLKSALPGELACDKEIFDAKILTRSLNIRKFYEKECDSFKSFSACAGNDDNSAHKFEQKFYLLLDTSRSMDMHMRNFYSKCIIAEFLKIKYNSNAKIYYRTFDSETGPLFVTEKPADFPALIEKVIFTTTGGSGTNMQKAVIQALADINFDKELLNSEILVVTDGVVDDLDKEKLKYLLGDTRLNILKIGRDLAEPNYFEMQKVLAKKGVNFDPQSVNLNDVSDKINKRHRLKDDEKLSHIEERIYQYLIECSEEITKHLKEISEKFIEIDDLNLKGLCSIDDDLISFIDSSIEEFSRVDLEKYKVTERILIYKRVNFLFQYIQFLERMTVNPRPELARALKELSAVRQRMLGDPYIYKLVSDVNGFEKDKKLLKAAGKDAKQKIKELKIQERDSYKIDIKKAKLMLTMSSMGEGSLWLLIKKIFSDILEFIKRIFLYLKKKLLRVK